MSAKRSFDVRREPAKSDGRRAPAPRQRPSGAARRTRGKSLKARREEARTFGLTITLVLLAVILGGLDYLSWRPEVRIQAVNANGEHASQIQQITQRVLIGTYFYAIPRDSVFFYPQHELRAALLDAFPDISSVSISRSGLTSLFVKTNARVSAFWWCGTQGSAEDTSCYEADAEGFIFAPVEQGDVLATSTAISTLRVFGALEAASTSEGYPLRAHMLHVDSIPNVLAFVRSLNRLNIPIVSLSIRDDEADVFTPSGTRITYVLGREEDATALATATFSTLDLSDGSIEYVDLRFPGKVYVKKKGAITAK